LDTFIDVINAHTPLVKLSRRKTKLASKPWITKGILKSIKTKKTHNNAEYLHTYKKDNNILTHIKKKSNMYYKQNLTESKGNLSKTWKIVNEIINKTKTKTIIPPLATSTNGSKPLDIVNTSNILNYFVEIGPTVASIPPTAQVPHTSGSSVIHSFFLSPVLPEDVVLQINLLNP